MSFEGLSGISEPANFIEVDIDLVVTVDSVEAALQSESRPVILGGG
jgi:hypothetical protein